MKKKEKKITNTDLLESINRSFSKVEERLVRHDKAFELLFKQMQIYTEEAREHR